MLFLFSYVFFFWLNVWRKKYIIRKTRTAKKNYIYFYLYESSKKIKRKKKYNNKNENCIYFCDVITSWWLENYLLSFSTAFAMFLAIHLIFTQRTNFPKRMQRQFFRSFLFHVIIVAIYYPNSIKNNKNKKEFSYSEKKIVFSFYFSFFIYFLYFPSFFML